MTAPARDERPALALLGPRLDLFLGCGLGYVVLVAALAALGVSMESVSGYLPFLILFTGIPHYGATLLRVYGTAEARRRYFVYAFVLGALVWGVFAASFSVPRLGAAFITLYLTWSPWHYARQNFGLVMMFLRKAGQAPSPAARRLVHASFVLSFVLVFANIHGAASSGGGDPLYAAEGMYRFSPLGIPEGATKILLASAALGYLVVTALAVIGIVRRASERKRITPALLLVASQALWFVAPVLVGRLAPGAYGPKGPTALAFLWVAIAHSVQYLWISVHYARASGSIQKNRRAAFVYLGETILAGAAIWFLPALLCAPGRLGGLPFESGLGLLVAAAVNVHHFILDGVIWKLRDPGVGAALLAPEKNAPTAAPRAWPARLSLVLVGGLSALGWSVAAWEKEMGERRATLAGDLPRVEAAAFRLAIVGRDGPRIHAALGRLRARRGDEAGALDAYRRSLALSPNPAAWVGIGKMAESRRDFPAAREAYEAAIGLDPRHATALDHLAQVFFETGNLQRALDAWYRATLAAPERPELRRRYDELRARLTSPAGSAQGEEIVVGGSP